MDPVKTMVRDVVCNMNVDPATARAREEYKGTTYYFCCAGCASKFKSDPEKYLAKAAGTIASPAGHDPMAGSHQQTPGSVKDPVCGMWVDPSKARDSATYNDKTYYFCSPRCAEKFKAEPEKYLAAKPAIELVQLGGIKPAQPAHIPAQITAAPSAKGKASVTYVCPMDPEVRESKPGPCPICGMALEPETVEYTCPMHPEIVSDKPGSCPICGMALEPRVAAGGHEEDDSELRSMTRRFWSGVALSIPLLILSMGSMVAWSPLHNLPGHWS
ncbi:MAG TPA: YHS domain-containing protein, partial [Verrucomicrobiae bacterium]|nr:YHS domain-containing protein [Verrucomicrobiae bacterium]